MWTAPKWTTVPGARSFAVLVAIGFLSSVILFRVLAGEQVAETRRRLAAVDDSAEGRLDLWAEWGTPQIHNRLLHMRIHSPEQPWLVTHAILPEPDSDPEGEVRVFGIDFGDLTRDLTHQEGRTLTLELVPVTEIARARLLGDNSRRVPRYTSEEAAPDGNLRAVEMLAWALRTPSDVLGAFAKDHPACRFRIRVGGAESEFPGEEWDPALDFGSNPAGPLGPLGGSGDPSTPEGAAEVDPPSDPVDGR